MKHHEHSDVNNRNVFLMVLEDGKSKIKILVNSVPGEGSLPGLHMAAFLLWVHRDFPLLGVCRKRENKQTLMSLLIRALIPS